MIAVTVAVHARFILVDTRVPRDLGLYYGGVPHAYDLLMGRTPGTADEWWHTIAQSTGWYHVVLAGLLALFGRNQDVFQVPDVFWVASLLGLVALIARRLGGDRVALTAVALTASMPGVIVAGRTGWLHVPEAVLALAGLLAWMRERGMTLRRTGVVLGLLGLLGFALRPSGLVWLGSLALPVLWTVVSARRSGARPPWSSVGWMALLWGLGSVTPLIYLRKYLTYKLEARERYVATLPDLALQAQMMLGAIPSWVIAVGLALGGVALSRWWRAPRGESAAAAAPDARLVTLVMLGAWVLVVGVLWIGFRAGIDNFTLLCPALAILAAMGFDRLAGGRSWGGAAPAMALVGFVPTVLFQFTMPGGPDAPSRSWPGLREIPSSPHLLNWYRPFDRFGEPEVKALVDATCGRESPPASCNVVVDQGLFCPFGEEPGFLELFLAGDPRVVIKTVRDAPIPSTDRVEALIVYHCGERDVQWRNRWPRSLGNLETLLEERVLEPVWTQEVGPSCDVLWYTKRGYLPHPDHLPAQGRRLLGGVPADIETLRKAPEIGDNNPQLGGPGGGQLGGPAEERRR